MKFGKTLTTHQIPEWTINYINYKGLKKIINQLGNIDLHDVLSQFFFELDRNIEKVDLFYNLKLADYERRLNNLLLVINYENDKIMVDLDNVDEIGDILNQLRFCFRNLKWFSELNYKGFIKILKKLDKRVNSLIEDEKIDEKINEKSINEISTTGNDSGGSNSIINSNLTLGSNSTGDLNNSNLTLGSNSTSDLNNPSSSNGVTKITQDQNVIHTITEEVGDVQLDSTVLKPLRSDEYTTPSNLPFKSKQTYKETYLSTRVNALPFANGSDITKFLDTISSILNQLSNLKDSHGSPDQPFSDSSLIKVNSFDLNYQHFIYLLIINNDVDEITKQLKEVKFSLKFSINCLHKAAVSNSATIDCFLKFLFDNFECPLYDQSDISGKNFFHHYIVNLNKKPNDLKLATEGLFHLIDSLDQKFYYLLNQKDNYLKTPLHYISQYGLFTLIDYWLKKLYTYKIIENVSIDNEEYWADNEGLTPLHLSIINNHPKTTEKLIKNSKLPFSCPQLLLIAARFNVPDILDYLINLGQIDINYTDLEHHHETALYIACKFNLYESVEFLLANSANTEIGESVFGWTPIFIAANEGFQSIVKLLIEFNAKYDIVDDSGWLPMEHACLRGHLQVADLLKPKDSEILLYDMYHPENNVPRVIPAKSPLILSNEEFLKSSSSIDVLPEHSRKAIDQVYTKLKGNGTNGNTNSNLSTAQAESNKKKLKSLKPLKSFGHRYLNPDESLILITLGTTDLRDHNPPIDLNKFSLTKSFDNELDTALSLLITCKLKISNEVIEVPIIIDLPLEDHHGSATDPITFQLPKKLSIDDIIITFDLIPTYQYPAINKKNSGSKIFGRAIALLKDAYTKVGSNLRSLHNNITIPILESTNLNNLGSIRFEYMLITPFTHPEMSIKSSDTYWKQLVSTRVIGHRGLGKNVNDKKSLQLGENTVESFIAAASLGASYVEFDVQLTKDYVPVIYHDFLVAESGVDIPMHSLTVEQFLALKGDTRSAMKEKEKNKMKYALDDELIAKKSNRPRSMSTYPSAPNFFSKSKTKTDDEDDQDAEIEREFRNQSNTRMKLTKTWKEQGFKGNTRGMSIQSDFVTLKELFKKLPKNIGFNIELKYPMLDEAEHESMGEIAIDRNFYVDTILKEIYDCNSEGRDIILSSFHPDICLLASLKQPNIPILFLTEAGTQFMADIRASSLQNAIRFAKKWNLLGIVSAAEALVKTPRLAQVVKSSGLVCVTYGTLNNEPELAKIQMKAGVDAVIVDSVLGVREGIRHEQEALNQLQLTTST